MKKLLYIFILIYSASFSQQEKFTAKATNNELLIGQPTQIKFELSFPASIAIDEISFPNFKTNDTLGNNWELWKEESTLHQHFEKLGLHHADDMSGVILTSYHRHLNNKDLGLDEQINHYIDFWKKGEK